jgi:hypothetical protein
MRKTLKHTISFGKYWNPHVLTTCTSTYDEEFHVYFKYIIHVMEERSQDYMTGGWKDWQAGQRYTPNTRIQ